MKNTHPLVCRFGALGDMVMITPLLKRLHERSGLPADIVTIGEWSKTLFDNMPYVRNVYTIKSRKTPYLFNRPQRELIRLLKKQPYESAWICESNPKSIRLLERAGFDENNSISASAFPRQSNEHFVHYWLRLADMSPASCDYPELAENPAENTELFVSDYEVEVCKNWLTTRGINQNSPLVCIQAGNKRTTRAGKRQRSSNLKYWPELNWAELIEDIISELPDAQILLCGVPQERSLTLDIKSLCANQASIFSVADDLPLRRLMALLSIAHSCISVDTGPAHIAAALNCPLTVLFGKSDARVYAPRSSESNVEIVAGRLNGTELLDGEEAWKEVHDLSQVTVGDVIRGWRQSLS